MNLSDLCFSFGDSSSNSIYKNYKVITSTTTWTHPDGNGNCAFLIGGAGGAGGDGGTPSNRKGGGGAGGNAWFIKNIPIRETITVTIGSGGTSGGSSGGSSSIFIPSLHNYIICDGGGGGGDGDSGGNGGDVSPINIFLDSTSSDWKITQMKGAGGSSYGGSGGFCNYIFYHGGGAVGSGTYGAGGGGASFFGRGGHGGFSGNGGNGETSAGGGGGDYNKLGGHGGNGIVIIYF